MSFQADAARARSVVGSALRGELTRRELLTRGAQAGLSASLINQMLGLDPAHAQPPATPATQLSPSADAGTTYTMPGLDGPAEIIVDQWGVPHIYASTFFDAFRVQGFNVARDRLWQIDIWRRRGLGQLAEVFGKAFVEQDRATRLFLYRGNMYPEWLAYGSDTKDIVSAFVEGINAYIDLVDGGLEELPFEFRELDYKPARWAAEDVVRIRSHGLVGNLRSEVARALILRDFGEDAERLRVKLEPDWEITIPDGLDLSVIPDDVLDVYTLATQPVEFKPEEPSATTRPQLSAMVNAVYEHKHIGSNNWTVSPTRTDTGRPMLANDPHRTQSVPSLRYITHLNAPDFSVIGAGEPALPGISIGHNGTIAFGLTVFSIDQEDLYIYETNPDDPTTYKYEDRWEPMTIVNEDVAVRDDITANIALKFTRHGPVIYEDPSKRLAFAVRTTWLEPGTSAYLGSVEYMRARNWQEFLAAMNRWQAPGENQVYADADGNIGWKPGGLTPIRPNWDGLLPVPGDGRYEWDGFRNMDELPVASNPDQGWLATANEMNLPKDYPYEAIKPGFEWAAPFRFQRIQEVLNGDTDVSLKDMLALQTDHLSIPARRVIALLGPIETDDSLTRTGLDLLRSWNFVESVDSPAAALWEVWQLRHLRPAVVSALLPPDAAEIISPGSLAAILDILETPSDRLGSDPVKARNELLRSTIRPAMEELQSLLGTDPDTWAWGDLHKAGMIHPLSERVDAATRARIDVGPAPRAGGGDTVGNTSYRASDFMQTGGSSWRIIVDVGEWDNALAMNTPGQSGRPEDDHYRDLFDMWINDDAFPLLYSRELIEQHRDVRITLLPAM